MRLARFSLFSTIVGVLLIGCSSTGSTEGGAGGASGASGSAGNPLDGGQGGHAGTGGGGKGGASGKGGSSGGSAGAAGGGGTGGSAPSLHFVAYGDTRTSVADHQKVVDGFAKVNPEVVVHTGDLWDGYSATQWKGIITKNANIGSLLSDNLFLVSRGNHESSSEFLAFTPTLVRENKEKYSARVSNVFLVSLGYDPGASSAVTFLDQRLQTPDASSATWRVVFSHVPIYSGGDHGADGVPSVEALCDKYNVSLFFSGHDHIYERSQQMYGQQIVDNGNDLQGKTGTVYIVAGGGGAPLYTASTIASTHTSKSTLHFVDLAATETSMTVKATKPDGTVFDSFVIQR